MTLLVPHIIYRTAIHRLIDTLSTIPYCSVFSSYRKEVMSKNFVFAPVGNSNSKTDVPNTYRAVGSTCPKTCKFHPEHYDEKKKLTGTCYAWSGHVRMQWSRFDRNRKRSTVLIEEINSAILAIYYRQLTREYLREMNTTGARLHVSGDFYFKGRLDTSYINSIYYAAFLLSKRFPNSKELAYTYTAIPMEEFEKYRLALETVNIYVNYSRMSPENLSGRQTIVWEHEKIDELLPFVEAGTKIVPCLSQTHESMTCRRCGLCGYKNQDKILVVFDPHGHNKNTLHRIVSSADLKDDGNGKLKLFFS